MQTILSNVRWFFTGLRLFLPLVPRFVWIAIRRTAESISDYWKLSQSVVDRISDAYMAEATDKGLTTEYDSYVYWVCVSMAAFLFLVGWLVQSWLIVQALRLLISAIF
jgi:hypothetical protein